MISYDTIFNIQGLFGRIKHLNNRHMYNTTWSKVVSQWNALPLDALHPPIGMLCQHHTSSYIIVHHQTSSNITVRNETVTRNGVIMRQLFCMYCDRYNNSNQRLRIASILCRFCGQGYCAYHLVDLKPDDFKTDDSKNWSKYSERSRMNLSCKGCVNDDRSSVKLYFT